MIYSKEIIVLLDVYATNGVAAGWGRIFTTRLTINRVAFSQELLEWGRTFSKFWVKRAVHIYG